MILLLLLSACATPLSRTETVSYGAGFPASAQLNTVSGEPMFAWHSARFRMPRGADGSSNWDADLLLAHKVIGPALLEYTDALPLWRFHRRSAPDAAGHQFSFIFFSDTVTADAIFNWIEDDQLIGVLQQRGLLLNVLFQHNAVDASDDLAGTSDPNWAPMLQRQWPSFIMGVSATWLGLIEEALPTAAEEHETIDDLLARYSQANSAIGNLWANEGQHAFLHHLSAVFGYQPMKIRKAIQF